MQENDQQSTDIQDYVTQAKVPGEKVIQPSAALIEEMKAAQAASSPEPAQLPTNPVGSQNPVQMSQPLNASPAAQTPVESTSPSSVYPEVTKGIGAETAAPIPEADPIPGPKLVQGATAKTTAVKIVAGALALLNLTNAYSWLISSHVGINSWIDIAEIVAGLILAIGIFSLKESARSIYVILSAVLLAFACISFIALYGLNYSNPDFRAASQPLTKARLENSLSAAEHNPSYSAHAKQVEIQQLQNEIRLASTSQTEANIRQYVSTALFFVTSAGPLVFFTRPSIKAVFN